METKSLKREMIIIPEIFFFASSPDQKMQKFESIKGQGGCRLAEWAFCWKITAHAFSMPPPCPTVRKLLNIAKKQFPMQKIQIAAVFKMYTCCMLLFRNLSTDQRT